MCSSTTLPPAWAAATISSSSKMEVEIIEMTATGLSMARRLDPGSRTAAMTGRFSSRLSMPATLTWLI